MMNRERSGERGRIGVSPLVALLRRRPFFSVSSLLLVGLIAASWARVMTESGSGPGFLSAEAWQRAGAFVGDLAGSGEAGRPAFLVWDSWREALRLAGDTLVMSVLAAGLAAAGALTTIAFGASNLAGRRPVAGRALVAVTRGVYLITRAVPELVWALIVVFVFSPGILAGAIALAIHNFGVLGRLGAEIVEDIDPAPIESLRSSGAGRVQLLVYGVLPQVMPQFITFLLYRWEVIIRTSVVVGLVAAAGLGYQFRLDLAFFRYSDIALLLIVYVLLVWTADLASIGLRRLAR
jgi:phosphonate transport system permease protein